MQQRDKIDTYYVGVKNLGWFCENAPMNYDEVTTAGNFRPAGVNTSDDSCFGRALHFPMSVS
jgi:hypothetical protein